MTNQNLIFKSFRSYLDTIKANLIKKSNNKLKATCFIVSDEVCVIANY